MDTRKLEDIIPISNIYYQFPVSERLVSVKQVPCPLPIEAGPLPKARSDCELQELSAFDMRIILKKLRTNVL